MRQHSRRMLPNISIHAPRTGSDLTYSTSPAIRKISIHAPRTGSDTASLLATDGVITFQSTLPARGATARADGVLIVLLISIHAPRTGSDRGLRPRDVRLAHFNPRSPHGERHIAEIIITVWVLFQSTLPARGATNWDDINKAYSEYISIHAPRTGSDQRQMADVPQLPSISIHAPRTGSDAAETWQYAHTRNFNPRSPHGERP